MAPAVTADPTTVARAIRVLEDAGIIWAYSQYNGLTTEEAELAVQALSDAGLLREPTRSTAPAPQITVDQAEALDRMRATEPKYTRTIARHADVLLAWCTAANVYRVTDHAGEHYKGDDLPAAVAAYNARVLPEAATARPTRTRIRVRRGVHRG